MVLNNNLSMFLLNRLSKTRLAKVLSQSSSSVCITEEFLGKLIYKLWVISAFIS